MILVTFYWRILELVLVSPDGKAFQWNCSAQILFITCVYTDIFNFITNWFLLMRVCSPNPLMKYRQYLQITHFFHPFPQTSYCHTSSQDNFIIEPLLLLYWWQQSFPRTVSTLQADTILGHQWKQCPLCLSGQEALPVISHSSFLLQPPVPTCKSPLVQTAQPNPLQPNKLGWQSLISFWQTTLPADLRGHFP